MNAIRTSIRNLLGCLSAPYFRGDRFYCPICRKGYRRFLEAGDPRRPNARCPGCDALERHRLFWWALHGKWGEDRIARGGQLLHVAPEPTLTRVLSPLFDYISVDLDGRRAMAAMDIMSLQFPDDTFDAVICHHVLEHIPDDRKALAELFRVMKRGGWGSISVPMKGEVTLEEPAVVDPDRRRQLFGQADHVRQYGRDFLERLKAAGFTVVLLEKANLAEPSQLDRLSVACETAVVLVEKPEALTMAKPS